jgi:peroxiredoxin/mono/diheme cytochrome c family protein
VDPWLQFGRTAVGVLDETLSGNLTSETRMKRAMNLKRTAVLATIGWAACGAATLGTAAETRDSLREAPRVVTPAELGVGRMVPDLEFAPISGRKFRLSPFKSAPATVIAFTSTSCPITKRYAPTLAALEKEFTARGVKFVLVNPIASDSERDAKAAVQTHGLTSPYVRDAKSRISAALGARSTAEVFVIDGARTLVYRGAIDDQYGLGYSLDAPKRRYLVDALNSVLAASSPAVQSTTAPGCALETAKHAGIADAPLTYHARISRIMQQHCVECHRAGGVAPFALESYDDVVSHAGMIRKQVERGAMPPWFAAPVHWGSTPWANDRTLPSRDKADLLAWLSGGKKKGNVADAPRPRQFPSEWEIGTPDMVVRIPEPIAVKATGTMPYQNVFVETKFTEDRWVHAMEVRPTARDVVHHVLVFVVEPDKVDKARRRGANTEGGNFFAVYVPGNNVLRFPDGLAKLIPAGSVLQFQIHYTPNGTATRDQTALGMVFAKTPPKHEVRVAAIAAKLDIPPGDANYQTRGKVPVPFDAKLMSFMPHMHVRGKAYRYELQLPNGTTNVLLDVPRYDFNWQLQYRLAEFVDAPAGSTLRGYATYDNSTNNPVNPDPTARVKWGEQTDEEMMLGYFEYYVPSIPAGQKVSLVEAAARDGGLIFNGLDKNRDGKLTPNESPIAKQFKDADADADGIVTRDEFRVYWQKQREKPRAAAP